MLVDITPIYAERSRIAEKSLELWDSFSPEDQSSFIPKRVQKGVWLCAHSNADDLVVEDIDSFGDRWGNFLHRYDDSRECLTVLRDTGLLSAYGVCDGEANLLEHPEYRDIIQGPRKLTIFLAEVRKGENGGWRWHKWGPYIGNQQRDGWEYLDEEPFIESVFIFHFVEHRDSPDNFASTS